MAAPTRPPRSRSDPPERWDDRRPGNASSSRRAVDDRSLRDPPPRRAAANGATEPYPPEAPARAPQTPGERLRAARLRRKISLAEAEQATRIRARYLQALEEDDYAALPSGVYSRGFLRNYAIYLGVPPDEVMAAMPERRRRERRPGVRSVASPIKISAPRSMWLIAAATAGVLVLVALIWLGLSAPESPAGSGRGAAAPTNQPQAAPGTPGSGSLVQLPPLATGVATALPTQLPTVAATSTAQAQTVNVEMRTVDRSWVRVTVDGRVVSEETYAPGQTLRWTGQQSVLLRVGNAAGVDLTVNGERVGVLGQAGVAVDREFRRPGAATPAPAQTPGTTTGTASGASASATPAR